MCQGGLGLIFENQNCACATFFRQSSRPLHAKIGKQMPNIYLFFLALFRFVLDHMERGRGLKPQWATKGIEFVFYAADPKFTKSLSDEEFAVSFVY